MSTTPSNPRPDLQEPLVCVIEAPPGTPEKRGALGSVPRGTHGAVTRLGLEAGMATAEYAIATLAACGFAAVLVVLMRSDEVRNLLFGIIKTALSMGS